ncbi:hypothetical protein L7F22_018034 [Adiantum nelumboides]|nr:hypothetical protein [Adiantum nelumboides]
MFNPSRVLGRECRDAGQVPRREPCPAFKSFLCDGGKVEDLLILSLCKRILQRFKKQQLPQPPTSQLKALIPAEAAEDSKDSSFCMTTDKHITPSMAVIQAEKVASSPPLQNKVFFSEQIPNAVVNDNSLNLKIPILTFNGAKDKTDTDSCSTTLVAAIESLDTTCSSDKPLQMDIPPNSTLSQSTASLQEDFTVSDKPMEYLKDFQSVVMTNHSTENLMREHFGLQYFSLHPLTLYGELVKMEITTIFFGEKAFVLDHEMCQFFKLQVKETYENQTVDESKAAPILLDADTSDAKISPASVVNIIQTLPSSSNLYVALKKVKEIIKSEELPLTYDGFIAFELPPTNNDNAMFGMEHRHDSDLWIEYVRCSSDSFLVLSVSVDVQGICIVSLLIVLSI